MVYTSIGFAREIAFFDNHASKTWGLFIICLFDYVAEYPAHMFSETPAMILRTVREGETWWDWPWVRDSQADENLFEPIPEMY